MAVASFIEKSQLSDEQFLELQQLVEKMKEDRKGQGG